MITSLVAAPELDEDEELDEEDELVVEPDELDELVELEELDELDELVELDELLEDEELDSSPPPQPTAHNTVNMGINFRRLSIGGTLAHHFFIRGKDSFLH